MAPLISPFLLFLIAALSIPGSSVESRIDMIDPGGTVNAMNLKQVDGGFDIVATRNGTSVTLMFARPVKGKELVYTFKDLESGAEETVDLPVMIKGFDLEKWRTGEDATLEGPDGSILRRTRSGVVTYITTSVPGMLLAVHP